jgi:hypothetical protein
MPEDRFFEDHRQKNKNLRRFIWQVRFFVATRFNSEAKGSS